jgi:hypothetical protein
LYTTSCARSRGTPGFETRKRDSAFANPLRGTPQPSPQYNVGDEFSVSP